MGAILKSTNDGLKWAKAGPDVIPAWVADMDLPTAPAVIEALHRRADGDLGYPAWLEQSTGGPLAEAFAGRMAAKYAWSPDPALVRPFSDINQALQVLLHVCTEPGDAVAVHTPAYHPFLGTLESMRRPLRPIQARPDGASWRFEVPDLSGCKVLLLVNPHNPTGRVFTGAELTLLAEVAAELDLVVLADEIHADLAYRPARHLPFASLSADAAARTITTTSATKAFNIAGLRCAVAHVGAERVHRSLAEAPLDYFGTPSTLSRVATVAAWREGDAWLAELMRALDHNRGLIAEWAAALPWDLRYHAPEATYLSWFDFTDTPLGAVAPAEYLLREARVKLSEGAEFTEGTDVDCAAFARLNFATSPSLLREILARLAAL